MPARVWDSRDTQADKQSGYHTDRGVHSQAHRGAVGRTARHTAHRPARYIQIDKQLDPSLPAPALREPIQSRSCPPSSCSEGQEVWAARWHRACPSLRMYLPKPSEAGSSGKAPGCRSWGAGARSQECFKVAQANSSPSWGRGGPGLEGRRGGKGSEGPSHSSRGSRPDPGIGAACP